MSKDAYVRLVTVSADNATALASIAKPTNGTLKVSSISAGFSAAAIKTLTVTDGSTTKGTFNVHNQRDIYFDPPLEFKDSAGFSLAASGTGGVTGHVTVSYFPR